MSSNPIKVGLGSSSPAATSPHRSAMSRILPPQRLAVAARDPDRIDDRPGDVARDRNGEDGVGARLVLDGALRQRDGVLRLLRPAGTIARSAARGVSGC